MDKFKHIDDYLKTLDESKKEIIVRIIDTIQNTVPEAALGIAYNMPAFKYRKKPMMYFAAFTSHIGVYALPSSNTEFAQKLNAYKTGKGSIQLPLNQPIPYALIVDIARFRKEEIDALLDH